MAKARKIRRKRARVEIPKEFNEPPTQITDYCLCGFGAKGVGKSSLFAQFPDSLTLMLEPKRRNLRIRQVNIEPAGILELACGGISETPWETLKEYVLAILDDKSVKTVVVDTVDRAYEACLIHHCFQQGINHPNDANDYGATWHKIKDDFETTMNKLLYADKGLVFISHCHLREIEGRDGMEQWIPTCSPACWKYLKAVCDFALYYGYSGNDRAITIRGNDLIWSACGTDSNFLTKNGELINQFSVGKSHTTAFTNLKSAFENNLADEAVLLSEPVS